MSPAARLVVLISGNGSNLLALIDAIARGVLHARIVSVISNNPQAPGLAHARSAAIPVQIIDHRNYAERTHFDAALADAVTPLAADLVVLAGFMRILTPTFIGAFTGRVINIHPSLLPRHPGLDTHQKVLDNGERETGATVHFVSAELDSGPAIVHAVSAVNTDDTASSLAMRVKLLEHKILPLAVEWCCTGRVVLRDDCAFLDDSPLPPGGWRYSQEQQALAKDI